MKNMTKENIRKIVREGYAKIARQNSCCGNKSCNSLDISKKIGYEDKEIKSVPEGSNLGLGCGNPVAMASLKSGETVLDLGSGAGFDCFLAANKVGANGKVIGVDMTPEMIEKARENAKKSNYTNVEFRLGEIENLPVADNSVDIVISNCVINLSTDKEKVFKETFRVLKPNGRMMISDIILLKKLPNSVKKSVEAYIGCIAGAIMKDEYINSIKSAGFSDVKIIDEMSIPIDMINEKVKAKDILKSIASIKVYGVKTNQYLWRER